MSNEINSNDSPKSFVDNMFRTNKELCLIGRRLYFLSDAFAETGNQKIAKDLSELA
jgi:hypothetical protein